MQRIQEGDREAFATLYARYNKTVYRIAYEATGNQQESLEVVKAVFREMYQTIISKGPYLGDLYGWLDALTAKQLRLRRFSMQTQSAQSPPAYTKEQGEYIEERAQARMQEESRLEMPELPPRRRSGSIIVLSVTALLLIWVLVGLLGSLEVLPQWNLGYNWFNTALFPLF